MVFWKETVPLLKSYRQALEQNCGFPGVFGDDNLMYQLDSHGIPCPYGYGTEDACAG